MSLTFPQFLEQIRSISDSEAHKGRLFERAIKTYFSQDPYYKEHRFSKVWLWSEWVTHMPRFQRPDLGIDLVARERDGGYCAIQCKCYAAGTRISKRDLESFISASARAPFTSRIVVDTGEEWGPNAKKTIAPLRVPCQVIHFGDLTSRPFDWPDLRHQTPEDLSSRHELFQLRPHQEEAFTDVMNGFRSHDRGKLIMACGTGKTFTALRIAEAVAGIGGRVLYLVPSIALFSQTMREWSEQRQVPHRYVGICSDTRAGRTDEDASLHELEIPVTTDLDVISQVLRTAPRDKTTVVFCTYHSLGIVERAQDEGAPAFDLIICDEAHRTTGIERPGDETSPFRLVHDAKRIRGGKRLYMTATPRLYTEGAKSKAAINDIGVFSMDDPAIYGPEFHRLPFSRAVDRNLLSDYRVVIFALAEEHATAILQTYMALGGKKIDLTDTTKIIGCWRALQNPENKQPGDGPIPPLTRAIAFTNTIWSSKRLETHWSPIVEQAAKQLSSIKPVNEFHCETRHVDGTDHALDRKARIEWLKGDSENTCRILSNARCLSEGIDVPALDAVLFMRPKKSQIDIVQAVGRVMRKAEGKEYGYIILPIAVPPGVDPKATLDRNESFSVVWEVLNALRSHDDRFNAEVNQIDLNKTPPKRIIFSGPNDSPDPIGLPFPPLDLPPGAIYAKVVEHCGDRKYWETWAKDVANIFLRLVHRIEGLLASPENVTLHDWFNGFHEELQASINESITSDNAIEMMAQHILTRPVFEALFEDYDFAGNNPVAQALDRLRSDFGEFGLENETQDLERFYESVRMRAQGLDNSDARQSVLVELYEKFFATALKKDADRLGIVYTPTEVVDFILHSADHVLRQEFGRGLNDEGVHVLDPFTGTGIFLFRLLQSQLIRDTDLPRKYREELHANEIVLLAYYIAAIHIEQAFHGRRGPDSAYEPFPGIVLTDTFNLDNKGQRDFSTHWLPDNSERVERQRKAPIQVIVGNPPWSAGQRSSADDNPNVDYPELKRRVAATYAARSRATLKNSLYDTYKMAIRWASDRIGEQGVVALVTNGSWIDGNADSGVRACLVEEFSSIYVLNLRGNQRTQGERSRREGGKIFGQGSRAPVAITLLVRNPKAAHEGCRILYRDIGDYLKREEKLAILRTAESIDGIKEWRRITPDRHDDWIGQRSEAFQKFYPMGTKTAKSGKTDDAIFKLYSRGFATSRDAYIYNFSRDACAENAQKMVGDYLGALRELEESQVEAHDLKDLVERLASLHSSNLRWDLNLKNNLRRRKAVVYDPDKIWETQYRPFVKQHCYVEYVLVNSKYQMDRIFPAADSTNRAIFVPGISSTKPFSVLVADSMPDLHFVAFGQCFPRYRYRQPANAQRALPGHEQNLERVDNISDKALRTFRVRYEDNTITKDEIFDYIYGVLHAPAYRKSFSNDLSKELPRIPFAPDFRIFAAAGHELARVHLGYETCEEYPLELHCDRPGEPRPEQFRIGSKKMRWRDAEKTELAVNEHIRLRGIPAAAHQYEVNGRTPIEWFIDRYRIKKDRRSGIVNDPNGWFEDPRELVSAFRRIVQVSVETVRIVAELPSLPES